LEAVAGALSAALVAGLRTSLGLLWDSLYGLILGFLISAVAQVIFTRASLHRVLGSGVRGVVRGAAFGIVASACSYGAAAAARGLFAKGADVRAVFAFLISSTNMNVAILILFWALLGWKFAFAEFAGGIIIIAVVTAGLSLLLREGDASPVQTGATRPALVEECLQCAMAGSAEHAVEHEGTTYQFCGSLHAQEFRSDPKRVLGETEDEPETVNFGALLRPRTWQRVLALAWSDVTMLRNELAIGYLVAGFAAALIPASWLAGALKTVGAVPVVGYLLLLLLGLGLAVITFVCSMGNVPIARFLAMAGIPLGANTTFIYGDLLVPPLIAIYRKSFPPKVTWSFVGLFVLGAVLAGAAMDALIGGFFGGVAMGSMELSDRITLVANIVTIVGLLAVVLFARSPVSVSVESAESEA